VGLFDKSDTTRIKQTLKYIRTTDKVRPEIRDAAYSFAQKWVNEFYPESRKSTDAYKGFSGGMSMKDIDDAGEKETRKQRRAIVLLWSAMMNTGLAKQGQSMGEGLVTDAFRRAMTKARIVYDMSRGIRSGNEDVFTNHLRRDPAEFLKQHRLIIYGIKAEDQPADNLVDFGFYYDAAQDRYVLKTNAPAGSHPVKAINVPAIYWGNVPGRGQDAARGDFSRIDGTPLRGSTVMLTTQFTGCTFCYNRVGGITYAAHIAPSNKVTAQPGEAVVSIDPTELARQIAKGGDFGNAPDTAGFRVYGREHGKRSFANGYLYKSGSHGSKNWMSAIGFEEDNGWNFYTQSISEDFEAPQRVRKLFPVPAEAR